jgi:hypothetical protein
MMSLQLYPMRDESTLAWLKTIDKQCELTINPETCFWVGSVSSDNEVALRIFLNEAEQENIHELVKHASLDDSLAYAVLVRDARLDTRFHLFVIEIRAGLWTAPRLLFGRQLSMECSVTARASTAVPEGIITHPKVEVWKSLLGGFFGL